MTISAGGSVRTKQDELDALQAQIAAIPAVPVIDTSEEDASRPYKGARIGALSAALSGRVAWDRVLRQVSLVLPEDVWLSNLSAAAPDTTQAAATGSGFTLTGATYSQNGVARCSLGSPWCPTSRTCASVEPEPAPGRARARPVHDPRRPPSAEPPPPLRPSASAQVPAS